MCSLVPAAAGGWSCSTIDDPAVIRHILTHLGLSMDSGERPRARVARWWMNSRKPLPAATGDEAAVPSVARRWVDDRVDDVSTAVRVDAPGGSALVIGGAADDDRRWRAGQPPIVWPSGCGAGRRTARRARHGTHRDRA